MKRNRSHRCTGPLCKTCERKENEKRQEEDLLENPWSFKNKRRALSRQGKKMSIKHDANGERRIVMTPKEDDEAVKVQNNNPPDTDTETEWRESS